MKLAVGVSKNKVAGEKKMSIIFVSWKYSVSSKMFTRLVDSELPYVEALLFSGFLFSTLLMTLLTTMPLHFIIR